jgi:hypothetical protein
MLIVKNREIRGIMVYRWGIFGLYTPAFLNNKNDLEELIDIRNKSIDVEKQIYPSSIANSDITFDYQDFNDANVYFFKDELTPLTRANRPDIKITASHPLMDADDPFRYTIQNAFDQNPATSFVEDTEDDLMECILYFSDKLFQDYQQKQISFIGIKVINGYAQNENLYKLNNRITKAGKHKLQETLDYQYLYYGENILGKGLGFGADEIKYGSQYSDTCLSELDFLFTDETLLFGDTNE